jgi:hypothetical protein
MPILSGPLSSNAPVIELAVGVGAVRAAALARSGQAVPPDVAVRTLIDTGAKRTCVDAGVIAALAVVSTDVRRVRTVSSGPATHATRVFDLSVMGGPGGQIIAADLPVLEADLAHQGIACLLGRDALAVCVLVYDGPACRFSLTF